MARGWWQNHTAVLTSIIDSVNIVVRVGVCAGRKGKSGRLRLSCGM